MATWPYNTAEWQRVRAIVLHRDGRQCQIRGARCKGHATDVDHVIRLVDGGPPFALSNLRAACRPCNSEREGGAGELRTAPPSRRW